MKAVVLEEIRKMVMREVPDAEMRETTDVLLLLTSTAIFGTQKNVVPNKSRHDGVFGR